MKCNVNGMVMLPFFKDSFETGSGVPGWLNRWDVRSRSQACECVHHIRHRDYKKKKEREKKTGLIFSWQ